MQRHCVVLAGGLGTRLREVTRDQIPKALVDVNGRPFLHYKLASLVQMGVTDVTVIGGQLGSQVDEFLKVSSPSELSISYREDGPSLLGTAGSIAKMRSELPDTFWVTYGDSFVTADLQMAEEHEESVGACSVMTVLHNHDRYEISNTTISDGLIRSYEKNTEPNTHEWIDYGLLKFSNESFANVPPNTPIDLISVIQPLIYGQKMAAFEVAERFWHVGDPEALAETEQEFSMRFGSM